MLSIIISSYQPRYYNALITNISDTIGDGFKYEIITIENPALMSIAKAYNIGSTKSNYENLLFLHEDLLFHTKNWGAKLLSYLDQEKTGIIGVAGSSYVPKAPCSWTVAEEYNFVNIIQSNNTDDHSVHNNSTKESMTKVFSVDGVFLAVKREVFNKFKFDEKLLQNFHGYDLDLSLSISKLYQNYVVGDILLEHFSKGNLDCVWLDANIAVKKKHLYKFQDFVNSEVEKTTFEGFLFKYFTCYPINISNLFFTLKFYPFNAIKFSDHIIILKKYLNYIRYSNSLNKKLNLPNQQGTYRKNT